MRARPPEKKSRKFCPFDTFTCFHTLCFAIFENQTLKKYFISFSVELLWKIQENSFKIFNWFDEFKKVSVF